MPDANNDPALLVLKVRAYLQKRKLEEAFQVQSAIMYWVSILECLPPVITKITLLDYYKGVF